MKILSPQTCLLLTSVFAAGCTNLSESRFFVPKDEEPDMKSAVIMEDPDSRPDLEPDLREEEDMRPELDMRDDGKCSTVADCTTGLPNVRVSCDDTGECNYQCVMDEERTWAVIQNHVIDVNGCNCEVLPEICNGEDEDCDGVPDNDLALECEVQDGVCAGALNYCNGDSDSFNSSCSNETYREHAANNGFFFSDNVYESHRCDGLDNNCDGRVDEACCNEEDKPKFTPVSDGSKGFIYRLMPHNTDPYSFLFVGGFNSDIVLQSLSQISDSEPQPTFAEAYTIRKGQQVLIGGMEQPIQTNTSRISMNQSTTLLANNTLLQLINDAPDARTLLSYELGKPDEIATRTALSWLPQINEANEEQHNPIPIIESIDNNSFVGGWVRSGNDNQGNEMAEFRACIGTILSQDCTTPQFTYGGEHTSPPQTTLTGNPDSKLFFLAYPTSTNVYKYTVFDAQTRQVANQQSIQLSSQTTGARQLGSLAAIWTSPRHVLLAQHAWYPDANTNQIDIALLDIQAPLEDALIAQKSVLMETTNTNAEASLSIQDTSDELSQRFVLLWSEDNRSLHSHQIRTPTSQPSIVTSVSRRIATNVSGIIEIVDTSFNGRHIGILITEARSNFELAEDIVLLTSPEGVPYCDIAPVTED